MAFRLKPDETPAKGVRRIVKDQIDNALDSLNGLRGEGPEEAVHDARRRFKKVRAVIRLARYGLGRKLSSKEDARFRDLGRPLSEVRDAVVLVETFDELIGRFGVPGNPEAVEALRAALSDRKREICRRVLHDEKALAAATAGILEARRGVKRWEIGGDDRHVLEAGLRRIYRQGYRAARAASGDPTDENLHECRKRVKDLCYALDILRSIRPDLTREPGEKAHELAEALGKDHDLAVLRQVLSESDVVNRAGTDIGAISPLIDRRRSELQRAATSLMREVYGEKPKEFVASPGKSWRARRSGVRAG